MIFKKRRKMTTLRDVLNDFATELEGNYGMIKDPDDADVEKDRLIDEYTNRIKDRILRVIE